MIMRPPPARPRSGCTVVSFARRAVAPKIHAHRPQAPDAFVNNRAHIAFIAVPTILTERRARVRPAAHRAVASRAAVRLASWHAPRHAMQHSPDGDPAARHHPRCRASRTATDVRHPTTASTSSWSPTTWTRGICRSNRRRPTSSGAPSLRSSSGRIRGHRGAQPDAATRSSRPVGHVHDRAQPGRPRRWTSRGRSSGSPWAAAGRTDADAGPRMPACLGTWSSLDAGATAGVAHAAPMGYLAQRFVPGPDGGDRATSTWHTRVKG